MFCTPEPEKFHILYKQQRKTSWLAREIKASSLRLALDTSKISTDLHTPQVWSGEPLFFAPGTGVLSRCPMCRNGPTSPVQKEKRRFTTHEKTLLPIQIHQGTRLQQAGEAKAHRDLNGPADAQSLPVWYS